MKNRTISLNRLFKRFWLDHPWQTCLVVITWNWLTSLTSRLLNRKWILKNLTSSRNWATLNSVNWCLIKETPWITISINLKNKIPLLKQTWFICLNGLSRMWASQTVWSLKSCWSTSMIYVTKEKTLLSFQEH